MTWTPPPGMTLEPLCHDDEEIVRVALVTLAPGAQMAEPETHDDLTERIRVVSGDLCVSVVGMLGTELPVDVGDSGGRSAFVIDAGVRHRLINWRRDRAAVYVAVMTRPREGTLTARERALDEVAEALRDVAAAYPEDVADSIVINVTIDGLRGT